MADALRNTVHHGTMALTLVKGPLAMLLQEEILELILELDVAKYKEK